MEFVEAESNMNDHASEDQQYLDATAKVEEKMHEGFFVQAIEEFFFTAACNR